MKDDPIPTPRSYLYVPGDRSDRFTKADTSGADAVVYDLEDAVALEAKEAARERVAEHLASADPAESLERWVRINTGERGLADLDRLAALGALHGVFVPKAEPDVLEAAAARAPRLRLVALVETGGALLRIEDIARARGLVSMAMGEVDLAADLGLTPSPDAAEMIPYRATVVVASAAAGIAPPIGPVQVEVRDFEILRRTTEGLLRSGFGARQAIHPAQVGVIHEVLTPTAEAIERAEDLLRSASAQGGGVSVDESGRMIDEAVLRSAHRLLARRR